MTSLRRALAQARARLGTACAVCRTHQTHALCKACLDRFAPLRWRCLGCAVPLAVQARHCGACLSGEDPDQVPVLVVAADYDFPWDQLIGHLKFAQALELTQALAPALARAVGHAREAHALPAVEVLLAVPMHVRRLRQRGYNQAELIAGAVSDLTAVPVLRDVLVRHTAVAPQHTLNRLDRMKAPSGSFSVALHRADAIQGRTVALIDDVVTTGATLRAAAQALRDAGAAGVQAWVVARTPA